MIADLDKLHIKKGFQLGDWVINPMSGKFTRNGHSVHVEPKLMDVLLCLAGAGGAVVTRDELMGSVWEGLIVSDEALTRCISELRTLLGDTARERRYIRTIPKRGYTLLQPVEPLTATAEPVAARVEPARAQGDHSIAVLPFNNLSYDKDQDYFCDGLTEELINALARFTQLRVAARTSTFSFKEQSVGIKEIGRKLNVGHVLEGSVRIAGDKLRITAQLVSVADGFQLWAEIYDRDCTDIFSIQSEISAAVARELNLKFGGENKRRQSLRPDTDNLDAYKWYLRGRRRFQTEQHGLTYTGMKELKKAVELDPEFADAHGLLAYLHILHSTVQPYAEVAADSRNYFQKALALNPAQPEALMAKAIDTRWRTWDWRAVRELFEQALQAAPNNPTVLQQYATRFYRDLGSLDKAEELLLRAIAIDPLNAGPRSALSYVLRYNRRPGEAIKQSELAIQLSPRYVYAHLGLILALIAEHEYQRALERITVAEGFLGADFSPMLECRARLHAQAGDIEQARVIKDKMAALANGANGFHYQADVGWTCIALGDLKEAVHWLNRSLDAHNSQVLVARAAIDVINDRRCANLREPLYQNFLRRMNMDDDYVNALKSDGLL